MVKQSLKYDEAMAELEKLVNEMEEGVSVDDLAVKIKRSAFLIEFCRKRLKSTEEDVHLILNEIKESE